MNYNYCDWELTLLLPESNEKEYIINISKVVRAVILTKKLVEKLLFIV